jgi:hypothetical protein
LAGGPLERRNIRGESVDCGDGGAGIRHGTLECPEGGYRGLLKFSSA